MFSRLTGKGKSKAPKPPAAAIEPVQASPFGGPGAVGQAGSGPSMSGASVSSQQGGAPSQAGGAGAGGGGGPAPAGRAPSDALSRALPAGFAARSESTGTATGQVSFSQGGQAAGGAAAAAAAAGSDQPINAPLQQPAKPAKPVKGKAGGIRSDLATPEARIQSPALMAVLNRLAVGADVSELVSIVCRHVVARPAPVLSKQLAYDVVKTGAPGDGDWAFVYAGMRFDLAPGSPPEVASAALAALQGLPPHRFAEALAPFPAEEGGTAAGRPDSNRGAAASPAVAQAPRPPVRQSPSAAPQPSAASFNTAPSAGGTASGAAANLAALNAAIQGSGASVSAARGNGVAASGPSTTVNGSFGMGAAPVQHQLGNREDSYSTAAGISFDGLGISGASTTSPAGPEPSIAVGRVDLRTRLGEALQHQEAAVRASAVEAIGRAVASPAVLAAIAASPTPENVDTAVKWAERLGDALLDGTPAVAAAGAAAVALLLGAAAGLAPDGTVAPGAKAVLPPEAAAAISMEPGAGSWVAGRAAAKLGWRATAGLSSILRRAHNLAPLDQVHVIRMLVALLEYAAARDFDLPPPALENQLPKAPPPRRQQELLPSLDPMADLTTPAATATGGELAGPWMIEVTGLYISGLLEAPAPALQFEAARALLRLSSLAKRVARSGHVAAPVAAATRWAPTAVTTILELWDRQAGAGGRAEIVEAVAAHLADLPSAAQPPLARQLIPLIAKLPFAAERADAFAKIWVSILGLDLGQRRAIRSGAPQLAGADLKSLLADPFVMHIAGASSSANDAAAKATYPAFRDELVTTLLAVVDRHPWAARSQELLTGPDPDALAALPRPSNSGPSSTAEKQRSAAEREASKFAAEAAYRQRIGETVDWLGSAKIVLQGTKACLGWERQPDAGLHACTAVVDAWLRLLQRALHALRALRIAMPPAPEYLTVSIKSDVARDAVVEEAVAVAEGGPTAKIGLLIEGYEATLQDLLTQIVTYWKALSPAVAPRALWVAAHHASLPRRLPGSWAHLLEMVDALLQRGLTDVSSKVFAAKQAVLEGSLSSRNAFVSAAEAALRGRLDERPERRDVILNEDGQPVEETEEAAPAEGGLEGPQAAADDAGIAVEGLEAAAAAVERLTTLLLYNSAGDAFAWSLKELAGRMLEVVQQYIEDPRARVDAQERLGRAARRIRAVASRTDAKPPKSEKEKAKEREKREKARAEAAAAAAAAMPEEVTEAADFNEALAAAGLMPPPAPAANGIEGATETGAHPPPPPPLGEEEELDEDELLAMMRMAPDPGAAQVEGYPFGPPPSAVLVATKRTARYHQLDAVVGAAVSGAYGEVPLAKPAHQTEVAGLPSLVEVMELVSGQVGGADSSASVELTGAADPLRLSARHELDLVARTLHVSFVLYNRLPGEVAGATVRLATGGPLARAAPGPVMFKLPPLPGRGSHAFRASFRLAGFGRLAVQPFVGVPLRGFGQFDAPLLRARQYTVSPVALLQAPRENVSGAAFFQAWPPIPYTADVTALAAAPGVDGGLLALSALERSPLARVLLTGLPALGGFQAAYLGKSLDDAVVALVVTGQLLPFEEAAPPEPPSELEAANARLAADPILGPGSGTAFNAEGQIAPPKRKVSVAGSRTAVRLTVRSTSAEIVSAIEADKPAFIQDLFDGALVVGSVSDAVATGFRGPVRLTPAVSALKWAYQPMTVVQPDAPGPEGVDEDAQSEDPAVKAGDELAAIQDAPSAAGSDSDAYSEGGSVVERPGDAPRADFDGETSTDSGGSNAGRAAGEGSEDDDEEAPRPPLPAPDLFDAVAEEWQRLRLAMQDVY